MKLVIDTHTHTLLSGHAYSSLNEMVQSAKDKNLEMIAITEHGPMLEGSVKSIYFRNLYIMPKEIFGVKVLMGVEGNIIDENGSVDMPEDVLKSLDFALAGFHNVGYLISTDIEKNTYAMIKTLSNPYIDGISHPGNPFYPIDIKKVVSAAKKYNKALEINNSSFENKFRKGSEENCLEILLECKKQNVRILTGSDAHVFTDVGNFSHIYRVLKQADFPEELVLNTSVKKMQDYINERKNIVF